MAGVNTDMRVGTNSLGKPASVMPVLGMLVGLKPLTWSCSIRVNLVANGGSLAGWTAGILASIIREVWRLVIGSRVVIGRGVRMYSRARSCSTVAIRLGIVVVCRRI